MLSLIPLPRAGVTFLVTLFSFITFAFAATPDEWRSRSIYQIVTDRFAHVNGTHHDEPCKVELGMYCGGTWKGIQDNLDYVQGMGFDAIWISPVVGQLPQMTGDGESYTAYWQQNLYATNSKFGTEEDLKELISDVHARGMLLMLDIVVNHMGYAGTPHHIDYSVLYPFNDKKYFHDYCSADNPSNRTNAQQCWLGDHMVPLADLKTEDPEVQNMLGEWIYQMVQNYSIDGLRIDTSVNVEPEFFPEFVKAANVFATGEVMVPDSSAACEWEETIGSILNYPVYYALIDAFKDEEGSIDDLVDTMSKMKHKCKDPTLMGSFSENHDVARFRNYTDDPSLARNIITFTMLADGIPIIYQGQEQHMNGDVSPYMNRAPVWEAGYDTDSPLYKHIQTLNKFRHHVIQTSHNYTLYNNYAFDQDYHTVSMRKGYDGAQVITVLSNNGESCDDYTHELDHHGYAPGTQLTEILSCSDITVNETGHINLPMARGEPKVLYPTRLMFNSRLCDFPNEAPSQAPQQPQTTLRTVFPTTISNRPTVYQTETTSALPYTLSSGTPISSTTPSPEPTPAQNGPGGYGHSHAHASTPLHSHPQVTSHATAAAATQLPKALGGASSASPNAPLVLSVSAAVASILMGSGSGGAEAAAPTSSTAASAYYQWSD